MRIGGTKLAENRYGASRQGRDRALVLRTGACRAVSPHSGKDPLRDFRFGRQEADDGWGGALRPRARGRVGRWGPRSFIGWHVMQAGAPLRSMTTSGISMATRLAKGGHPVAGHRALSEAKSHPRFHSLTLVRSVSSTINPRGVG